MADHPPRPKLHIGIVLVPDFTLLAFAGLIDTLRLAADERDLSRPLQCRWHVMSADGRPVCSSSGIAVEPTGGFADPTQFDYVAVVGGTLHRSHDLSIVDAYLARAASVGVPLIGLCTGAFHLARAGLMQGRRACLTWLHREEFSLAFPEIAVVTDELFVLDRDRITCAGGTGVIHLASHLIERHLGAGASAKGLRLMLEERVRAGGTPQPAPRLPELDRVQELRVRRAILLVEQSLATPLDAVAIARRIGVSPRQLHRLFVQEVGYSISELRQKLRMMEAHGLVLERNINLTEIAATCGFADAAHFSRAFKQYCGVTPSQARKAHQAGRSMSFARDPVSGNAINYGEPDAR